MNTPRSHGISLGQCDACGHTCFPMPLACPRCHGTALTPTSALDASVEETTSSPRSGIRIATVRTSSGVALIARVDSIAQPGTVVPLSTTPGTPGTAFVPDRP